MATEYSMDMFQSLQVACNAIKNKYEWMFPIMVALYGLIGFPFLQTFSLALTAKFEIAFAIICDGERERHRNTNKKTRPRDKRKTLKITFMNNFGRDCFVGHLAGMTGAPTME